MAPFLLAVQRVVGRVHVQHDLLRGLRVCLQEQLHQQRVEPLRIGHDALVAVLPGLLGGAQLEPVEGAGAGQRMAPVALAHAALTGHVGAAEREREQAVVAQGVMVIDILVAEREPVQALGDQVLQGMLAARRIAVIAEAGGHAGGQLEGAVGGPQDDGPAVRGHAAAVEAGDHLSAAVVREFDCGTVCRHEAWSSGSS